MSILSFLQSDGIHLEVFIWGQMKWEGKATSNRKSHFNSSFTLHLRWSRNPFTSDTHTCKPSTLSHIYKTPTSPIHSYIYTHLFSYDDTRKHTDLSVCASLDSQNHSFYVCPISGWLRAAPALFISRNAEWHNHTHLIVK